METHENKFDPASALAEIRQILPSPARPESRAVPACSFTELVQPIREAGYTIVSVVGSRPVGQTHTPLQPYNWTEDCMRDLIAVAQQKVITLTAKYGKVCILARSDGFDLGTACLRVIPAIRQYFANKGLDTDTIDIIGQPVECFEAGAPWKTEPQQLIREAMLRGEPAGSYLPPYHAFKAYETPNAFRAVEGALVRAADFTLLCHGPRFRPDYEVWLQSHSRDLGCRYSDLYENLHRSLPSQVTSPDPDGETVSASAGFVSLADRRMAQSGAEDRFEEPVPEQEETAPSVRRSKKRA